MTNNVYLIHEKNMVAFNDKMEKLNKKASKARFSSYYF